MGISELLDHPYSGQSHSETQAETGNGPCKSHPLSDRAWSRLQVCALKRGPDGGLWRSAASMGKFRLRTKLLFSLLLVGVGLTAGTLFVARQTAERQVRLQIFQDLRNSVYTFQNV